ncbi:hypothetical protein ANO14919_050040 [Xylariales sp. No.14919]|nr:hypothetical protein ANO14919_050040 [Xylariales sp. No.14919]
MCPSSGPVNFTRIYRFRELLELEAIYTRALQLMEPGAPNDNIEVVKAPVLIESQAGIKKVTCPLRWLCLGTNMKFASSEPTLLIFKLAYEHVDCSSLVIDDLIEILRNGLPETEFEELAATIVKL